MEILENVTFKYKFSDDYNPIYVNGAYGGIGPRGEIIANFYLERPPVVRTQQNEVLPGGEVGAVIAQDPPDANTQIIRFIETGIVMNLESARRIHQWLGNHIQKIEQLQKDES